MQTPLFHYGSIISESDIPELAANYEIPENVVSEVLAKIRLKGTASPEDYPEEIQPGVEGLLQGITTTPDESKNEITEKAAFSLMGAMAQSSSFIITPDGICTINPENPPDLVHAYQVVSGVLELRKLGSVVDDKSSWMLGSILSELRSFFGEEFEPSQVAELTEKSYNTLYTAEKVYDAYKGKRFKLSFSHHKEAFFQKIPDESKDLILKKAETFGLGPKDVRSLSVIVKKLEDDQVIRNIRSKEQAEDLIKANKENKVRYLILNEDKWFEFMGTASSIPTGRLVIDLKNLTVRKDNGQPVEIRPLRKG